ncbi:MAG: DUF1844 domain-containing protein [Candidatus Omnitrophica bacterium]|nr:DUF1844 domain-containing protein [Candidatus Omnitrophota bacterium]
MDHLSGAHEDKQRNVDVNFVNYITSLGLQALIFLGETPSPISGRTEKNLDQARILIDTLVMLQAKTRGNLNEQEDSLLTASIYELQIKYTEVIKADGFLGEEER